jgi:hypothetical protein
MQREEAEAEEAVAHAAHKQKHAFAWQQYNNNYIPHFADMHHMVDMDGGAAGRTNG